MADSDSSDSSSIFSPNTIMAIVTLVGGLFLVSNRLSSDRPRRTANEGTRPLGYQNIESRLWEDPFSAWDKLSVENRTDRCVGGLTNLAKVLTNGLASIDRSNLLVLGVMISGQPYAEDAESRVRARYAVGAALGAAGYKPAEAGHIGLAACYWPESEKLHEWTRNTNSTLQEQTGGVVTNTNPLVETNTNLQLRVPFEQYDIKEFHPAEYRPVGEYPAHAERYRRVLLLWLDEEYFDDEPAVRLALFFEKLQHLHPGSSTNGSPDRVIIGPRSSTTLRALLASGPNLTGGLQPWTEIAETLRTVRMILATPTAMDEVLVGPTNNVPPELFNEPRGAVTTVLGKVFHSVTNFACTDKLIASEAIEELKLRGIDPAANAGQHLVLISEWDTFFSRMSGLAFAAELAKRQANATNSYANNALEFITQTRNRTNNSWPPTLHRFVYLQGLDGESAERESARGADSQEQRGRRQHPESIGELAHWTPEVNKAEGPAQFDYLTRLADVLGDLDRDLWRRQNRSRIAAVGIIGSDVYDTLLILQALRDRLPDVLFFTVDLDARFWNPGELRWSRNLVVLSGYGLRLRDDLQAGVAPFRDSSQCAQFLATLNAVGDTSMGGTGKLQPRRFEIGRGGPVDLSIEKGGVHPPTRYPLGFRWWVWLLIAVGILAVSALVLWKRLRQIAFPSCDYCCGPLAIDEEDLGGSEGVRTIVRNLEARRTGDKLAAWLLLEDAPTGNPSEFSVDDFADLPGFVAKLKCPPDILWTHVRGKLSSSIQMSLRLHRDDDPVSDLLQSALIKELQQIVKQSQCVFDIGHFKEPKWWRGESKRLHDRQPIGPNLERLNRMLLEDAFMLELVKRADEQWIERQFKLLIRKCNALVFPDRLTLPQGPGVEEAELIDSELGPGLRTSFQKVRSNKKLSAANHHANRLVVNDILVKLSRLATAPSDAQEAALKPGRHETARSARQISLVKYERRRWRPVLFWITALLLAGGFCWWAYLAKYDTYDDPKGEPFNLMGTSAWPAELIRLSVFALSVFVVIRTQRKLSEGILEITRRYRLNTNFKSAKTRNWQFKLPEPPLTEVDVDANQLWSEYNRIRHWFPRLLRVLGCVAIYFGFAYSLSKLTSPPFSPLRGNALLNLDKLLLICSVLAFLFVTFWIIDAARCCAWFIRRLSQAPTQYPGATLEHFARQRSIEDHSLVEEWIDLQLIADLTEPVGRLVYWPFLAVLLLIAARNPWWDHWTWHWPLLVIFVVNLILAAASSIILQNAAREARKTGVQRLKAKVHEKQRKASSVVEHESDQAESLLDEINNLRRGAFVPLSKNPLVGALLMNSSGVVLLQILAQLYLK